MTKLEISTTETATGKVISIESSRPSIWALIPGVFIFGIGAVILWPEIHIALATKTEPHIWHLVLSGGICLLGVIVPFYRQIIPGVKQLLIVLGNSSLPIVGGRRASDPPLPPAEPPPQFPPAPPTPPGPQP